MFLLQLVYSYRKGTLLFTLTKNKITDVIQKTEQQYMEELSILKDPNVGQERKIKAKRNLKNYEKYLKDNSDQETNGKKYPEQLFHSGPEPMNKTELYKLIDSVEVPNGQENWNLQGCYSTEGKYVPDPSGVSVGKNRFIEIDQEIDIRTSILDLYKPK